MFQDTRPAEFDADAGPDAWAEFLVAPPAQRLRLLRELRDGSTPVMLIAPGGAALASTLWSIDEAHQRLSFSAETAAPQLAPLVDADEAVAVAYLESVKLQFDLRAITLVRGPHTAAVQCALPQRIYRFQRRSAYRVRLAERSAPTATLRHPALPDMQLALRVLDLSIGGCALWLPDDVPPLQAGTKLGTVQIELDAATRFAVGLALQHVSASGDSAGGARLGCEWVGLNGAAERQLQRWIDRAQQRRRLLAT